MARSGSPTIKDIATASGVSFQTVSLALRGRRGVSDERRKHIRALARQMGYYPRAAGRMLASGRTGQVGIIFAHRGTDELHFEEWSGQLLYGFVQACEQSRRHYHIEFHHHSDDADAFVPPHSVASGMVDGVILVGDVGKPLRDWLRRRSQRFVSLSEPSEYCVIPDESLGMRLALEHLHQLGHRRIAVEFGPQRYQVQRLRRQAFAKTVYELGLEVPDPQFVLSFDDDNLDDTVTGRLDEIRSLLSRSDRPTAVIGATRATLHVAMELGLNVPRDLSVIDWRNPRVARTAFYPALTVIHTDQFALMREAVDLLDAQLEGREVASKRRQVKPRLCEADSTGPVPKGSV